MRGQQIRQEPFTQPDRTAERIGDAQMRRAAFDRECWFAASRSIFSSALASARGLRVSSAPVASARNSRRRETSIASACAISGASTIATTQMTNRISPAAPLSLSLSRLLRDPREPAGHAAAAPIRQQRNRADHGRNDGHQANIKVAHMAQLVGDHTLKLVARHLLEQVRASPRWRRVRDRGPWQTRWDPIRE